MEKLPLKYLKEFYEETNSNIAKKILDKFEIELSNFKQVCPIEMLDKLDNPITLRLKKYKSKLKLLKNNYQSYFILYHLNYFNIFPLGKY